MGNRQAITNAGIHVLKVTAQAASININDITPALTAAPMFLPIGCCMAFIRGLNIITAKGMIKMSDNNSCPVMLAKYKIAPITIIYNAAPIYRFCLLVP